MSDNTRLQTELKLLSALEQEEVVSQQVLSRRLSVSVGLINALLKRAVQKGLVKAKAAPYKRWAYYLTPKGFTEKSKLVAEYLESSLGFFRMARGEYVTLFTRLQACRTRCVVVVGQGELVEIALLAAREGEVEIIGLLDREINEERLYGLPVLRHLDEIDPSVPLILTASRHPQEAYDALHQHSTERVVLAPAFMRVVERGGAARLAE